MSNHYFESVVSKKDSEIKKILSNNYKVTLNAIIKLSETIESLSDNLPTIIEGDYELDDTVEYIDNEVEAMYRIESITGEVLMKDIMLNEGSIEKVINNLKVKEGFIIEWKVSNENFVVHRPQLIKELEVISEKLKELRNKNK